MRVCEVTHVVTCVLGIFKNPCASQLAFCVCVCRLRASVIHAFQAKQRHARMNEIELSRPKTARPVLLCASYIEAHAVSSSFRSFCGSGCFGVSLADLFFYITDVCCECSERGERLLHDCDDVFECIVGLCSYMYDYARMSDDLMMIAMTMILMYTCVCALRLAVEQSARDDVSGSLLLLAVECRPFAMLLLLCMLLS